jgi:tetratricopeptide (TPR) repeat protein
MKKSILGVIFITMILLSFQKPAPVQPPQRLAQAYGALLDSLEKFKHNSFEEAIERVNFLITLSANLKNWEIHCKALNHKIVLAEHYDKINLIELFINDFETKLANIDPKYFPQLRFYKSEVRLRRSEFYSLLRQPDGVIEISKEIVDGIKNNSLAFEDNSKAQQYALYDLGYWTSEIGQITEGINYFLLSKQLNDLDPTRELDFGIILNVQLAKRHLSLGQYEQSFNFFRVAQDITEELYKKEGFTKQNSGYVITNFHGIGKYYIYKNKPDSALIYLEKAEKFYAPSVFTN